MSIRIDGTNTAANPGITGSDTDTGLQFGTDEVNIVTGGSTRATVDSSGRLLVGTSSNITSDAVQIKTTDGSSLAFTRDSASSTSANGLIRFRSNEGDTAFIVGRNGATQSSGNSPGQLEFFTTPSSSTSPTERMRIDNGGNVLIATTSINDLGTVSITYDPAAKRGITFRPTSDNNSPNPLRFLNSSGTAVGNVITDTTSTAYNTSSDYRLKENVVDLDGAIDRVKQLAPKRFNFIVDADRTVDGFLAHEAQTVVPEAVTGTRDEVETWKEGDELPDGVSIGDNKLDEDGNTIPVYQGIDQSKLVPLLTAALQEAIAKIETLETTNASQAATIAALDARLTALEGGTN